MTGHALAINASAGAPEYSARQFRNAQAALMGWDGVTLGGRQGLRPTNATDLVTLVSTTITVNTHTGLVTPGWSTATGSYQVALTAAETHTLTGADGTNPRKDIVVGRVYDHDENPSSLRLYRSEYIVGTPAGSPSEPAVPTGAIRLATIDVPQLGGGSAAVTLNHTWTCASGGIMLVNSVTMRTALVPHYGEAIFRVDRNWVEAFDTAWRVVGTAHCSSTTDRDAAITNPYNGQLAVTTDTGMVWLRHSGVWRETTTLDAVKAADKTVNNSTTLSNDTELVLPVQSNAKYRGEGFFVYSSATNADAKFALTGPAGATALISGYGVPTSESSVFGTMNISVLGFATDWQIGGAGVGTTRSCIPHAYITTGGTAGNVTVQFAQQTAQASNSVLHIGSWITLKRIG